jgi:putative dimethyl sulfoxide reductase chaperone
LAANQLTERNLALKYETLGQLFLGLPKTKWLDLFNYLENEKINQLVEGLGSDDECASAHYALFGMNVFPYSNFFLGQEGSFAGEAEGPLLAFYARQKFNYEEETGGMGPTHLGTHFRFLSFLLNKQLSDPENNELRKLRRQFYANHLFTWLLPLNFSVQEVDRGPFSIALSQGLELAKQDWLSLNGNDHLDEIEFRLPPDPYDGQFLEQENTGLRNIAEYLMTPGLTGMFVSKGKLSSWAKKLDVPHGFGDRKNLMENVLKESVRYEKLAPFVAIMKESLSDWRAYYLEQKSSLDGIASQWLNVLDRTSLILDKFLEESKKSENNESLQS